MTNRETYRTRYRTAWTIVLSTLAMLLCAGGCAPPVTTGEPNEPSNAPYANKSGYSKKSNDFCSVDSDCFGKMVCVCPPGEDCTCQLPEEENRAHAAEAPASPR